MTSNYPNGQDGSGRAKRGRIAEPARELSQARVSIDVACAGGWMAAEELRETALKAMEADGDITLNLDGVDHLDASSLQILLALGKEQKKRGRHLDMVNASSHLRRWFEYSGAADDFFRDGAEAR